MEPILFIFVQGNVRGLLSRDGLRPGFFEAAALGVAKFRRCGFADVALGIGTTLDLTIQSPSTTHSLRLERLEAWLESSGKSPAEQALKGRLKNEIARMG